jgi:hypothetical protein
MNCRNCGSSNFSYDKYCHECGDELMSGLTRMISDIDDEFKDLLYEDEATVKWRPNKDAKKVFSHEDIERMKEDWKANGKWEYIHSHDRHDELRRIREETKKQAFQEAKNIIANSMQNAGQSMTSVNYVRNNINFV